MVELETEKVNLQVSAEASGVLERIVKPTGETVHVGEALATVAAGAEQAVGAPTDAGFCSFDHGASTGERPHPLRQHHPRRAPGHAGRPTDGRRART